MTEHIKRNYEYYRHDPRTAGELFAVIGLLRNNEQALSRHQYKLLIEYTKVMGYALESQPLAVLESCQQIFKQIMAEHISHQMSLAKVKQT